MYKSVDAGKSWTHIGLEDTQHIAKILIDSRNSNAVFVAAEKAQQGERESFEMARGNLVLPKKAGLNRFEWDMRCEPPGLVPGAVYDNGPPRGVLALPGKYEVKLVVAGKTYSAAIETVPDPRAKISASDLEKQFTLATQVRNLNDEDHKIVLMRKNNILAVGIAPSAEEQATLH